MHFTDLDDLNEQASTWCDRLNQKVHRTTRRVPLDLWVEENLLPLPADTAWERYGAEERRVSLDGFVSFDGVLYGLPSTPATAGAMVQVWKRQRELRILYGGQLIATHRIRPRSRGVRHAPGAVCGRACDPVSAASDSPCGTPGRGSPRVGPTPLGL